MTDLQGAIGIEQMKKLNYIIDQRIRRAQTYDEQLKGLEYFQIPSIPEGYRHVYQSYVIQLRNPPAKTASPNELNKIRNGIMFKLEEKEIATRQGTHAVHTLGYYRQKYRLQDNECPASLAADRLSITLPLYTQMTDAEQQYVIDNLLKVTRECLGIN